MKRKPYINKETWEKLFRIKKVYSGSKPHESIIQNIERRLLRHAGVMYRECVARDEIAYLVIRVNHDLVRATYHNRTQSIIGNTTIKCPRPLIFES
jgi:hypothetical protein